MSLARYTGSLITLHLLVVWTEFVIFGCSDSFYSVMLEIIPTHLTSKVNHLPKAMHNADYDYEERRTIDMEWGGRLTDLLSLRLRIYRGTQSIIIRPKSQVDTSSARNAKHVYNIGVEFSYYYHTLRDFQEFVFLNFMRNPSHCSVAER